MKQFNLQYFDTSDFDLLIWFVSRILRIFIEVGIPNNLKEEKIIIQILEEFK